MELPEATQAVYLERLRRVSSEQIRIAGERTIEEWEEASKMPPLSFILERCWVPVETPPFPKFKTIANQSGVTREEIQKWLEDGKRTQREYQHMLAIDPSLSNHYEQTITAIRERFGIRI